MNEIKVNFRVNSEVIEKQVEPRTNLSDFLRNELRLTGTHVGCEHGVCGACTINIDGMPARSCLTLVGQVEGSEIVTIEGLDLDPIAAVLRKCFAERNALQCGFCTPGIIVTAISILKEKLTLTREEIRKELSGNYCRCTGYEAIVDAIEEAALQISGGQVISNPLINKKELGNKNQQGHIGQSTVRFNTHRLLVGKGSYVDDLIISRQLHIAFLRSPVASGVIKKIDYAEALNVPGVIRILTNEDIRQVCTPWQGVLTQFPMVSPIQTPLADGKVFWQGQAIAAVVAETRAVAEDAIQLIDIEIQETEAVIGVEKAISADAIKIHGNLANNICMTRKFETNNFEQEYNSAPIKIKKKLHFSRLTGVPLEPRTILADFKKDEGTLMVNMSHQAPHMMRDIFAKHFNLQVNDIRVVCKDVGGGFGIKVHSYAEEMAAVAASIITNRPVKYTADRLESFGSDIHAREHEIEIEIALTPDGKLVGFDLKDYALIGAFSSYPRTSVLEGFAVSVLTGGPYKFSAYRSSLDIIFQNKVPTSQYRSVGHPISCAVAEVMVDHAARELGLDPIHLRRINLVTDKLQPYTSQTGILYEALSHEACLNDLENFVDYSKLREQQQIAREEGKLIGFGVASLIEMTAPGVTLYAIGGAPISSQDGAIVRLESDGSVTCVVAIADQGQGSDTAMAQIAATTLSVHVNKVRVVHGDTAVTPIGGGAFGSRTIAISGEAVLLASEELRKSIINISSIILKVNPEELVISNGEIFSQNNNETKTSIAEIAKIGHFRQDLLPKDFEAKLVTYASFYNTKQASFTNGIQASLVEIDPRFGTVKLLKHWVVEDCGTIINPLTAEEQIRGGVVQGLGMALFEECKYNSEGQLLTITLADYLVPMAAEMPDIKIRHISTKTPMSKLGAKGAGEAGTSGAPAAVMNAVNDALAPLGVSVNSFPITPENILRALGKIPQSTENKFN